MIPIPARRNRRRISNVRRSIASALLAMPLCSAAASGAQTANIYRPLTEIRFDWIRSTRHSPDFLTKRSALPSLTGAVLVEPGYAPPSPYSAWRARSSFSPERTRRDLCDSAFRRVFFYFAQTQDAPCPNTNRSAARVADQVHRDTLLIRRNARQKERERYPISLRSASGSYRYVCRTVPLPVSSEK